MATTVPTTGFEINTRILQNVFIGLALVMVGLGLGSALDSGRTSVSVEAAQLTQGQQAASASQRLLDYTDGIAAANPAPVVTATREQMLTDLANRGAIPAAAAILPPAVVVAEHGAFTPLAVRDISELAPRYAGGDISVPDVVTLGRGSFGYKSTSAEHGEFTAMAARDISGLAPRFAGSDIGAD